MTEYTETTVYPEIEKFLKTPGEKLADYFDCNSYKLQLQQIYKSHQKAGTLSPEKEKEITSYANRVHKLQTKLEKELVFK